MIFEALFRAYAHSTLGQALRRSTWTFAIVEVVHLLALAVLGGVVLVTVAAALGLGRARRPVAATVLGLRPVFLGGLVTLLVSGALLVGTNPMKYYFNDAFRAKMLLLVLALAATFWLAQQAGHARERGPLVALRIAAAVSLILWVGVALGGRLIGLL